ncbi:hypothetical protein ACIA8R_42415 [Nonomuraea sp. NPDC051191]|uniref:hypothetical protein n=1 Tax=Nonomuraea sp. NPDC051191 TaxID=3364372 RepID=UPI0037A84D2D
MPWPNVAPAAHPAFTLSVERLTSWGISPVLDPARLPQPSSGAPEDGHISVNGTGGGAGPHQVCLERIATA